MRLEVEQTASILSSLGYEIDRNWKFKLRSEKTPSASINPKNGSIKDFGSGWNGSVIDLMVQYHNYSMSEAFKYVEKQLVSPSQIDFSKFEVNKQYKTGFISKDYIENFINQRKENFPRFWHLLSQTLPTIDNNSKQESTKKPDNSLQIFNR